jgi:prepilin-type N-terminal cleavage/methylation domain-containing protein/prepilin-type processing-associated H-X9-DG protein
MKPDRNWPQTESGGAFTLTELLLVITIMGVLAALVVGVANGTIQSGRTAGSLSNMKQLTGALLSYAAENNNLLPDSLDSDGALNYCWDLQLFPYLGIQNEYNGTISPQMSTGLDLKVFRCPLDSRQMVPNRLFYPRSYGVTASAVCMSLGGGNAVTGGILGRRPGEGIRLAVVTKPSQYVILTRVLTTWESVDNLVGRHSFSLYDGPDVNLKPGQHGWENDWGCFKGKTAFGFADGHVALLTPQEAALVDPNIRVINR